MARGWARRAGSAGEGATERWAGRVARTRLSRPHRQERGGGTGAFLLANGRGGMLERPSRWRASRSWRSPNSRALRGEPHPAGRADPAGRDRGAFRRPDRGARGIELRHRLRLAARPAQPPTRRDCAGRAIFPVARRCRQRECWRRASPRWASTACRGRSRSCSCATAWSSCAAEGDELAGSVRRRPGAQRRGLAGAVRRRQDGACAGRRRRSRRRACALLPWDLPRRLDAEAPTHFAAPTGSAHADRLRGRGGPDAGDPRAGIVRPRPAIRRSPAGACRWCWSCCRRRTGRSRSRATCRASGAAARRP